MQIRHLTALLLSAAIWFVGGVFLLRKGLYLLTMNPEGGEETLLLVIAVGLLIGWLKGRFVLSRSVDRISERILSLPSPFPIKKIYPLYYYGLILIMVGFGFGLKLLPLTVRAFVDVAIGSALLQGSFLYLRRLPRKKKDPVL